MTEKINCRLVQDEMSVLVDGQLLAGREEFAKHIESCGDCQRVRDDLLFVGSAIKGLEEVEPGEDFSLRLHDALQEAKPKKKGSQRFVIFAAAAAIILMMMLELTGLPSYQGVKVSDSQINMAALDQPMDMMTEAKEAVHEDFLVQGVQVLVEREEESRIVDTIEKYGSMDESSIGIVGKVPLAMFDDFSREIGTDYIIAYDAVFLKQDLEERLRAVESEMSMWQESADLAGFIHLEVLEAEAAFLRQQLDSLKRLQDYVIVFVKYR